VYAIRNKITEQWVYGTDYRYNPPHQRISNRQALTFEDRKEAEYQFNKRRCGRDYKIVKVELKAIE